MENFQKKKVGNYILMQQLGKGQFGVVYKAVPLDKPDTHYAIKVIDKSKIVSNKILSRLFETEMSVMGKIDHPNIMHLYEFMETKNRYYMVIRYCGNGDLESYLKKVGQINEEEVKFFLK